MPLIFAPVASGKTLLERVEERRPHVETELQLLHPGIPLRHAPRSRAPPELYRACADLEQRVGHTLSPARVPLPELTSVTPTAAVRAEIATGLDRL